MNDSNQIPNQSNNYRDRSNQTLAQSPERRSKPSASRPGHDGLLEKYSPTELFRMLSRMPSRPESDHHSHEREFETKRNRLPSPQPPQSTRSQYIVPDWREQKATEVDYDELFRKVKRKESPATLLPSVQLDFLQKRARYELFMDDTASVASYRTEVSQFSESVASVMNNNQEMQYESTIQDLLLDGQSPFSLETQNNNQADLIKPTTTGNLDFIAPSSQHNKNTLRQQQQSVLPNKQSQVTTQQSIQQTEYHLPDSEDTQREQSAVVVAAATSVINTSTVIKKIKGKETKFSNLAETTSDQDQEHIVHRALSLGSDAYYDDAGGDYGDTGDFGDDDGNVENDAIMQQLSLQDNDPFMDDEEAAFDNNVQQKRYTHYVPSQTRIPVGDCFTRKKIENLTEKRPLSKESLIPYNLSKYIFDSKLPLDRRSVVNSSTAAKITNLYFDQLIDDLLSYKQLQVETGDFLDQDELDTITEKDMFLYMKRTQILKEGTTIEGLAHKYLPREYNELFTISAKKDNILHPNDDSSRMTYSAPTKRDFIRRSKTDI